MNRLIIIGNGFDIAHQMNTRYYDFIEDYIRRCFTIANESDIYTDSLLTIRKNTYYNNTQKISDYTFHQLIDFVKHNNYPSNNNDRLNYHTLFFGKTEGRFVTNLLNSCLDNGWVNIENMYYKMLKEFMDGSAPYMRIVKLHEIMKELINQMHTYFSKQNSKIYSDEYQSIFEQELDRDDVVKGLRFQEIVESTLFLNFNYTNTADKYIKRINSGRGHNLINLIHIHGKCNDEKNKIIFGFGDELDADYVKIEEKQNNEFFSFIKSFSYFQNSNYQNLIRFIEADIFQVFILGHSCGLSDRTMLNMIFEHENCKSIKIFYHKTETGNNYTEITHDISRHFRDKVIMRIKIVPFDRSMPMPQVNE